MTPLLHKITLIGVGLIGGSFVLDAKRHQLTQRVCGIDLDTNNLKRALERRVIDDARTEICASALSDADLVVIATPVATLPEICRQISPLLPENTIISDVGSTKQSTIAAFRQHLPHHFSRCVAAHPIAGSDRSGATAAQFGLYDNKKLILCPHEAQDEDCLKTVERLWQHVGAQTHRMNAAEHDAIFAAVSHLPHLLAFAYVHQLLDDPKGKEYLHFAGSGFRDFTRIAASNAHMWKDIILANRPALLDLIAAQQQQLNQLTQILHNQDAHALLNYLAQAREVREQWGQNNG
ncbi:MAG: prephenate dehydrogenase/arogenate dehydrogenase family protein [Alysiella sp.]|uniref:prephenate dehydrogenase n=1 Tax=Alysiella sp. TaxID=1872483 RepID=UPI0026DCA749|nr:prephenate dehydrogenase/arogenate dehydrogenase family protein [Alysiella sp.]MDO4432987.1 prephenate dehydrogenase/arogenate dehydrogenase family protein [Alysiella sp.]